MHKQQVLHELRDNLKAFKVGHKNQIDIIIDQLSVMEIREAIDAGYNRNNIKRGEIPGYIVREARHNKYITLRNMAIPAKRGVG